MDVDDTRLPCVADAHSNHAVDLHLWQPPHQILLALLPVATGFFWMTTIEHSQEAERWQWKSIRTRREDFDAVMLLAAAAVRRSLLVCAAGVAAEAAAAGVGVCARRRRRLVSGGSPLLTKTEQRQMWQRKPKKRPPLTCRWLWVEEADAGFKFLMDNNEVGRTQSLKAHSSVQDVNKLIFSHPTRVAFMHSPMRLVRRLAELADLLDGRT